VITDCDGNDCAGCMYEYTVLACGEPPDFYGRVPEHEPGCERFDALASVLRQHAPVGDDCDDRADDPFAPGGWMWGLDLPTDCDDGHDVIDLGYGGPVRIQHDNDCDDDDLGVHGDGYHRAHDNNPVDHTGELDSGYPPTWSEGPAWKVDGDCDDTGDFEHPLTSASAPF